MIYPNELISIVTLQSSIPATWTAVKHPFYCNHVRGRKCPNL